MAASVPERIEQRTNCTIYSRLDDRDGGSVEPDQTLAGGDKGDGGGGLLLKVNRDKNQANQLSVPAKWIRLSWLFNRCKRGWAEERDGCGVAHRKSDFPAVFKRNRRSSPSDGNA